MSRELLLRISSTILFLPILIYGLFGSFPQIVSLLVLITSLWSINEVYTMAKKNGYTPNRCIGYLGNILLCVLAFQKVPMQDSLFLVIWLIIFLTFILELLRYNPKSNFFLPHIGINLFGVLYTGWALTFLIYIRQYPQGGWYILWLIITTWFSDIGAYTFGNLFGKHKLCPQLSPGKTIEGFFGGIFLSLLVSMIYWYIVGVRYHFISFNLLANLLLAILINLAGVIGDLGESMMKRQAGIKDSGNTYTGHGGILDIVDSLLVSTPLFYLIAFYLVGIVNRNLYE